MPGHRFPGNDDYQRQQHEPQTTLATTVTVRIVAINAAGNLTLEGKRELSTDHRKVTLFLHAVAGGKDVTENQVLSTRLSDLVFNVDGLPKKNPLDFVRRFVEILFNDRPTHHYAT